MLAVIFMLGFAASSQAQPSVTQKTPQSAGPRGYFLPNNNVPIKSAAPVTPSMIVDPKAMKQQVIVIVPEKQLTPQEIAKREQKKLEFQTTQAEAGRDFAQYDMGMRYLKGDGVAQNSEE